jgi:hypothetical protein
MVGRLRWPFGNRALADQEREPAWVMRRTRPCTRVSQTSIRPEIGGFRLRINASVRSCFMSVSKSRVSERVSKNQAL